MPDSRSRSASRRRSRSAPVGRIQLGELRRERRHLIFQQELRAEARQDRRAEARQGGLQHWDLQCGVTVLWPRGFAPTSATLTWPGGGLQELSVTTHGYGVTRRDAPEAEPLVTVGRVATPATHPPAPAMRELSTRRQQSHLTMTPAPTPVRSVSRSPSEVCQVISLDSLPEEPAQSLPVLSGPHYEQEEPARSLPATLAAMTDSEIAGHMQSMGY